MSPIEILKPEIRDTAIVIALGSNMGVVGATPDEVLERALHALADRGIAVRARSRLWRSKAWPDPAGAEYRNAVCLVETLLEPKPLLELLHTVERAFGRVRGEPNAPRTLDLDLIAYGRRISPEQPVLPHPRAAERLFVMGPLTELLPDWTHPVSGATAADLARSATVGCDATPIG